MVVVLQNGSEVPKRRPELEVLGACRAPAALPEDFLFAQRFEVRVDWFETLIEARHPAPGILVLECRKCLVKVILRRIVSIAGIWLELIARLENGLALLLAIRVTDLQIFRRCRLRRSAAVP